MTKNRINQSCCGHTGTQRQIQSYARPVALRVIISKLQYTACIAHGGGIILPSLPICLGYLLHCMYVIFGASIHYLRFYLYVVSDTRSSVK
jgi:hypothetical protein